MATVRHLEFSKIETFCFCLLQTVAALRYKVWSKSVKVLQSFGQKSFQSFQYGDGL